MKQNDLRNDIRYFSSPVFLTSSIRYISNIKGKINGNINNEIIFKARHTTINGDDKINNNIFLVVLIIDFFRLFTKYFPRPSHKRFLF